MIDFNSIFQIKQHWKVFCCNHPKVAPFVNNVKNKPCCVGQEIAVAIRYPDGTEYKAGIRVTESDLYLLNAIRNLAEGM